VSVSEITSRTITDSTGTALEEADTFLRCDQCHAPVDSHQRYCVICGAHRRDVPDPAARYLNQASARARAAVRVAQARANGRSAKRRVVGFGTAALIALIPAAGIAGYAIGDSGSGSPAPAAATHAHSSGGRNGAGSTAKRGAGAGGTGASHSTGSSYVQSQKNSPNSVSVP